MPHVTLRQSTAGQEVHFPPILDAADLSPETGLTIANTDIKISKAGATAEGSKNSGGATHKAAGRYYAVLDATDTDTIGSGRIDIAIADALPVFVTFDVLSQAVFDVLYGSTAPSTYAGGAVASVSGAVGSVATGGITAASLAADAITADKIAADAVTEIQAGLATAANLGTVAGYLDTEIAAIKAQTDLIPAAPAATGDIPSAASIASAVRDVNNATPAADSLGAAVNAATSGGLDAEEVADLVVDGIGTVGGGAGSSVPSGEVVRGLPHAYRFVPTAAVDSVVLLGPDYQVAKAAPTAVDEGDSSLVVVTPDELGEWMLVAKDAGGAVVHSASFRCVNATAAQHAVGLQPAAHALVTSYPYLAMSGDGLSTSAGTAMLVGSGTPQRTLVSKGKNVVPMDGYIWGVENVLSGTQPITNLDSLRFFTADSTGRVRGISNDFSQTAPSATGPGSWRRYLFTKPVYGRAGDWWGLEVDDTSNSGATHFAFRLTAAAEADSVQRLGSLGSLLNLGGTNAFANYGSTGNGLDSHMMVKLLYAPPAIAVAGLSHWAGSPNSGGVYSDHAYAYSRAQDMAAMLEGVLGVQCVQCGWGGTNIKNWVGTAADATLQGGMPVGMFEKIVAPLKPSVMLYDSVYNDAAHGFGSVTSGLTEADYRLYLDRLLTHCHQAGIELVVLEAFGSYYSATNPTGGGADYAARIERLNAIVGDWCQRSAVLYVPLNGPLGQYYGGSGEHRSLRRTQKRWATDYASTGLPDYMASDTVHLTAEGRKAAAMVIAQAFRGRRYQEPRLLRTPSLLADETPPLNLQSAFGF